jgi:hypothetical protein
MLQTRLFARELFYIFCCVASVKRKFASQAQRQPCPSWPPGRSRKKGRTAATGSNPRFPGAQVYVSLSLGVADGFRLTLVISALAVIKLSGGLLEPPEPVFEKSAYVL